MLTMNKHVIPNVSYTRLETHELLLRDTVRVESYRNAIEQVIKPGDVVVDLGTGTGILSFLACQAGAKLVYAIEREQIIHLAKLVAKQNGYDQRIYFIEDDVSAVNLPQKVDVLLSECLGSFGLNTTMLNDFLRTRDSFLKPDGRVIPSKMTLFAAPFSSSSLLSEMQFWKIPQYGIDFSAIADDYVGNQMYVINLKDICLLAPCQPIHRIDFSSDKSVDCSSQIHFTIDSPGEIMGICGWFDVDLAPGVCLSTSPELSPTSWYQVMFPVHSPITVLPGDLLRLNLANSYDTTSIIWEWKVTIERMDNILVSEAHCSVGGFPKVSSGIIPTHYPSF